MNSVIQETRTLIASLKAKEEEARANRQSLQEAQNRLAILTAKIVIAIDDGKRIEFCGASTEVKSTALSLSVSWVNGLAEVKHYITTGSVTFLILVGQTIKFAVDEDDQGNKESYCVSAFASLDEAMAWAKSRGPH